MNLTDQAEAERKAAAEPRHTMAEGLNVVDHLQDVMRQSFTICPSLVAQEIRHRRLGAFDLRAADCLDTHMRCDQQVGVRKYATHSSEPVDRGGGLVQPKHSGRDEVHVAWQRIREERRVPLERPAYEST